MFFRKCKIAENVDDFDSAWEILTDLPGNPISPFGPGGPTGP